jgi:hypothetical protein
MLYTIFYLTVMARDNCLYTDADEQRPRATQKGGLFYVVDKGFFL